MEKPQTAVLSALMLLLLLLMVVFFIIIITTNKDQSSTKNLRHVNNSSNFLLWSDEFDGSSLKDGFWVYDTADRIDTVGGDSLELAYYNPHSVTVENGVLTITTTGVVNSVVPFISGRIKTEGKVIFQYGTIEAKIKVSGPLVGLSPSFWTSGSGLDSGGTPIHAEIDIFRTAPGNHPSSEEDYSMRGISGAKWERDGVMETWQQDYAINVLDNDFHVYKLDWTPNRLATFVDGQLVWEMDISDGSCRNCQDFHHPHFILLSLAVVSVASSTENPIASEMTVDYVRLFDNGFSIAAVIKP
jgi:beta-glucanase (GH16 family)